MPCLAARPVQPYPYQRSFDHKLSLFEYAKAKTNNTPAAATLATVTTAAKTIAAQTTISLRAWAMSWLPRDANLASGTPPLGRIWQRENVQQTGEKPRWGQDGHGEQHYDDGFYGAHREVPFTISISISCASFVIPPISVAFSTCCQHRACTGSFQHTQPAGK